MTEDAERTRYRGLRRFDAVAVYLELRGAAW
jgi:hypothetical protein